MTPIRSSLRLFVVASTLLLDVAACGNSTQSNGGGGGGGSGGNEGGSSATSGSSGGNEGGSSGGGEGGAGGGTLTGTFGTQTIKPMVSGIWIGMPSSPSEASFATFVYLFSQPVTCADISTAPGWITGLPAGTQVLEMIIGAQNVTSAPLQATSGASPGLVEINYSFAPVHVESRATAGTVAITSYVASTSVDGTLAGVVFPQGSADGTFHAEYCPMGREF